MNEDRPPPSADSPPPREVPSPRESVSPRELPAQRERPSPRDLDAETLLAACRWEAFRASGPGGQKRNKTSSAIRITHVASGLSAIANESRSQSANREKALRRLMHRLAIEIRRPVDAGSYVNPPWLVALISGGRLSVSQKHADYFRAIGLTLDVLAAAGWSVSDASNLMGLTTGNLVAFLREDERAWAQANRGRAAAGLRPLNG